MIPPKMVTVASVGIRNVIFGVNVSNQPARSSTLSPPRTGPTTSAMNTSMPVQSTPAITWT